MICNFYDGSFDVRSLITGNSIKDKFSEVIA